MLSPRPRFTLALISVRLSSGNLLTSKIPFPLSHPRRDFTHLMRIEKHFCFFVDFTRNKNSYTWSNECCKIWWNNIKKKNLKLRPCLLTLRGLGCEGQRGAWKRMGEKTEDEYWCGSLFICLWVSVTM